MSPAGAPALPAASNLPRRPAVSRLAAPPRPRPLALEFLEVEPQRVSHDAVLRLTAGPGGAPELAGEGDG